MGVETVEHNGVRYAEIIRHDVQADKTTFFSPSDSSLQLGLLVHKKGYSEAPHHHKKISRKIDDLQQMFVVQKGVVEVKFFDDRGKEFKKVRLLQGDGILLMQGAHSITALEDMQCISVKQGPFLGDINDKVALKE